jgi:hypothetical protein
MYEYNPMGQAQYTIGRVERRPALRTAAQRVADRVARDISTVTDKVPTDLLPDYVDQVEQDNLYYQTDQTGGSPWLVLGIGAALLTGLGVGGYYLWRYLKG